MKGFWYGFEKRAVTNKTIYRSYIHNLLSVLKASKDPTDKAVHGWLYKKLPNLDKKVTSKIREMGEAPAINWAHNVKPMEIKSLIHEAKIRKHEPGWARDTVVKALVG